MRLLLLVLTAPDLRVLLLFALSLRLSDMEDVVVVLARFKRSLRIRKMSDILCGDDFRSLLFPEADDEPDEVDRNLGFPISRVPLKQ